MMKDEMALTRMRAADIKPTLKRMSTDMYGVVRICTDNAGLETAYRRGE